MNTTQPEWANNLLLILPTAPLMKALVHVGPGGLTVVGRAESAPGLRVVPLSLSHSIRPPQDSLTTPSLCRTHSVLLESDLHFKSQFPTWAISASLQVGAHGAEEVGFS